tara:strand:+ start:276 stop:545 length:270 start_codon:yes stop_codon:yes gene_type:complete
MPIIIYNGGVLRNNNTKEKKMAYNALNNTINFAKPKRNEVSNEFKKIVKHLMAKGYSKLEAKRLAQQATTQLAMSRLAMEKAIIPDDRG